MKLQEGLSYDDVLLVPQYSTIESRSEIDTSSELSKDVKLGMPIIASPMDTVVSYAMAIALDSCGAMAVVHRYNKPAEQASLINRFLEETGGGNIAMAIGVTGDYEMRAQLGVKMGVKTLCIDVAHGHHILMERALKSLKDRYADDIHIMAGNVATLRGIDDLASWGADSVRCNIGGGSICSTRIQTGHGVPGLETILRCSETTHDVKIIADGGIRNSGDIVKALAAGADFVMIGSLLAGTIEAPGQIIYGKNGATYKSYRGMASAEAQMDWRGNASSIEGVSSMVPTKGHVSGVIAGLERGLRSGLSYSGAHSIKELQAKAQFIKQTPSGQAESNTHILQRNGVFQ